MQFTISEGEDIEAAVAAAGPLDPRVTRALGPLLLAAGFGQYLAAFSVTVDVTDGQVAVSVTRGDGPLQHEDVLSGGATALGRAGEVTVLSPSSSAEPL